MGDWPKGSIFGHSRLMPGHCGVDGGGTVFLGAEACTGPVGAATGGSGRGSGTVAVAWPSTSLGFGNPFAELGLGVVETIVLGTPASLCPLLSKTRIETLSM